LLTTAFSFSQGILGGWLGVMDINLEIIGFSQVRLQRPVSPLKSKKNDQLDLLTQDTTNDIPRSGQSV